MERKISKIVEKVIKSGKKAKKSEKKAKKVNNKKMIRVLQTVHFFDKIKKNQNVLKLFFILFITLHVTIFRCLEIHVAISLALIKTVEKGTTLTVRTVLKS